MREEIYAELRAIIPELERRECTPRVARETGMDRLLDELLEFNAQLLQSEIEFDLVFGT